MDSINLVMYTLNGFLTGVFAVLILQVYLVYRFIYQKRPSTSLSLVASSPSAATNSPKSSMDGALDSEFEQKKDEFDFAPAYKKWPPGITNYLSTFLPKDPQPAEILTCTNAFLHRFFIEARNSPVLNARLKAKLLEKIGNAGGLVQSVAIEEVSLGDHPPLVDSISLMGSENLDVIFECGIIYEGGLSVRITTLLNIGIRIPVHVQMGRLQGRLQIRIPSPHNSKMFAAAFTNDPGLELLVESSLWRKDNEMLKDILNSLIAKRLRNAFVDTFVLPNWRSFNLPLLNIRRPDVDILRLLDPDDVSSASTVEKNDNGSLRIKTKRGISFRPNGTSSSLTSPVDRSDSYSDVPQSTRRRFSFSNTQDCLTSKCFSINSVVTASNVKEYSQMLITQFSKLATGESTAEKSFQDAWTSSNWESTRSKKGVTLQKKTIFIGREKAEVQKAFFDVNCSLDKTFQVLSNPEHWRHTDDSFVDSIQFDSFGDAFVKKFTFRVSRSEKTLLALEVKKKIEHDGTDAYIVAYRSVKRSLTSPLASGSNSAGSVDLPLENNGGGINFVTSKDCVVFLMGYMITPLSPVESRVTILSQWDSQLTKLNPSVQRCQRLKLFIEELAQWSILVEKTGNHGLSSSGSSIREQSSTSLASSSGEKLKNIWTSAYQAIKAGKNFASRKNIVALSPDRKSQSTTDGGDDKEYQELLLEEEELEGVEEELTIDENGAGVNRKQRTRSLSEPSVIPNL